MSRIGKLPIQLPKGVTAEVTPATVKVKGPKGEMTVSYRSVTVAVDNNAIHVTTGGETQQENAYHGLYRSLFANAVNGVSAGFRKELQVVGVGWRAEMKGSNLVLLVGYSHPVEIQPPKGIAFKVEEKSKIVIEGIDRQLVGQVAADVRKWRPPEPYQGKGIRYMNEVVRQKAGKAGAK